MTAHADPNISSLACKALVTNLCGQTKHLPGPSEFAWQCSVYSMNYLYHFWQTTETSLQNNSKIEFISIHHHYSLRTWQFCKRARACKAAVKPWDEWVKRTWSSSPVCARSLARSLKPSAKEAIILLNLESSYSFLQQATEYTYVCVASYAQSLCDSIY